MKNFKPIVGVAVATAFVFAAGPARADTINLSPLFDTFMSFITPILGPILLSLILAFAGKFPVVKTLIHAVDSKVLLGYINTAISYGVSEATKTVDPRLSKVDFKNQVANVAASWLADQIPQRLTRLGISPESVRDRVLAYVPGHEEVQAALSPATVAPVVNVKVTS